MKIKKISCMILSLALILNLMLMKFVSTLLYFGNCQLLVVWSTCKDMAGRDFCELSSYQIRIETDAVWFSVKTIANSSEVGINNHLVLKYLTNSQRDASRKTLNAMSITAL